MKYTLEYIASRMEIQDLCTRYSLGVDQRNWDLWESCFTEDAFIDYTVFGGNKGGVKEIRTWLEEVFTGVGPCQHFTLNMELEIDGDTATNRVGFYNPMPMEHGDKKSIYFCGGWYCDKLVKTSEGWKFSERVEEYSFNTAVMDFMRF